MGRLILVRHGKTKLNSGGGTSAERIRGWKDVPLDQEGKEEARRLGRQFEGRPVVAIYTSPLSRAVHTAEAIGKTTGIVPRKDFALIPWNLGYMTGEPVKAILSEMNWHVEHEDQAVRNGEPFANYRKRFLSFLHRKVYDAAKLPDDDLLLLVTHSRGLQITKAWMANDAPDDLSINVERMLDYKDEVKTGGEICLGVNE
jgi:broad specificity phosphatase PhoE